MADKYWFKHDYNARNDEKLLELRAEHGPSGYGIFWMLIEKMAEHNQGWLDGRLKGGITIDLGIDKNNIQTIVDFCLDAGLFHKNSEGFIFNNRMLIHKELRQSLSDYGKKGVEKREQNRLIKPPLSHPSSDKKREDKIRTERKDFVAPSLDEVKAYFVENGYADVWGQTAFETYSPLDWHDTKGNVINNWKTKMRAIWFKPERKISATVIPFETQVIDHRKNAHNWK